MLRYHIDINGHPNELICSFEQLIDHIQVNNNNIYLAQITDSAESVSFQNNNNNNYLDIIVEHNMHPSNKK